jgi:site-specific recombinase XerD
MVGLDIRTVQELLGHKDVQTTERCVKFVDSMLSKATIEARAIAGSGNSQCKLAT